MEKTAKDIFIKRLLYGIIFVAVFVLLIVRAPFGWVSTDEAYYITCGQRFFLGDSLITDEWWTAQNWGFVEYIFYSIFHIFSNGNDGIILWFRYLYCFLWTAVSLTTCFSLAKKFSCSLPVFAFIVLFAPFEIMTLCYNTGMLAFMLLSCCLMFSFATHPERNVVLYGFLFAVTSFLLVLCCPFMIIGYVLGYALALIVLLIMKNNKTAKRFVQMLYVAVPFIAVFAAFYLFLFVLNGETAEHILANLDAVLHLDSSHSADSGAVVKLYRILISLVKDCPLLIATAGLCAVFGGLIKKNKVLRLLMFILLSLEFAFYQLLLFREVFRINQWVMYMAIFGTAVFFLLKNKPLSLFVTFSLPGSMFAICEGLQSNTGLMAFSFAALVCGVPAIVYVLLALREMSAEFKGGARLLIPVLAALIFVSQFSVQLYEKAYPIYRYKDDSIKLECGAEKGIIADKYSAEYYKTDYANLIELLDMAGISRSEKIKFLSYNHNPVIYVDADLLYGTYSSWTDTTNEERTSNLNLYYKLNPENIPSVVLYTAGDEEYLPDFCNDYTSYSHNGMVLLVK